MVSAFRQSNSWCRKIVDDIIVWAATHSELETRLNSILERCQHLHVTLSCSKFHIDTTLNFAGCVIFDKGISPDPNRILALSKFPVPTDQTAVRSFLGLCNQLAFFILDFQHHTVSLRQLTGKGRSFLWLLEHQVEFDKLKKNLSGILRRQSYHFRPSLFRQCLAPAHRIRQRHSDPRYRQLPSNRSPGHRIPPARRGHPSNRHAVPLRLTLLRLRLSPLQLILCALLTPFGTTIGETLPVIRLARYIIYTHILNL